ncbi:hypothetical protein D9M68_100010 [compost metagenome]
MTRRKLTSVAEKPTVRRLYRTTLEKRIPASVGDPMQRIATLEREIETLRNRVSELRALYQSQKSASEAMMRRFRRLPKILQGVVGEQLAVDVSSGALMPYGAKFDVETPSKARLEVKVSSAYPTSTPARTRWIWGNVLGTNERPKEYDFLLLLGANPEADCRSRAPEFIYFFVHRSELEDLSTRGSRGRRSLQLTTNPSSVRSAVAEPLFDRRVSYAELVAAIERAMPRPVPVVRRRILRGLSALERRVG